MPAYRPAESVAALPLAEHAVLWCLRLWVEQARLEGQPVERVRQVFDDLGVPNGADAFMACMHLLHRDGGRLPRVHRLGDRVVGEEEALLLDVLALQQQQRAAAALGLLDCITRHAVALRSFQHWASLARALEARGLWLARRPAVGPQPWLRCFPAAPLPGSLQPANLY
jgi:hypothetical protein